MGANELKIYFCLFLLTAEFLMTSLKGADSLRTALRWVRSVATVWRHSFLEATVKREPAYLPEAVSVKAGGLCPECFALYLRLSGEVPLRRRSEALSLIVS